MNQTERRAFLLEWLLAERGAGEKSEIPKNEAAAAKWLRALMNVRLPAPLGEKFLRIQDEYLSEETRRKGITELSALTPIQEDLYLWRGDITTLRCDGIVNAANSQLLGCFCPCHGCIDNAIHSFAGIQLRLECAEIMNAQKYPEPTGRAKLTRAYNLPCKYVLHTVGPMVSDEPTKRHRQELASCYASCFSLAAEHGLDSIAFCCISTGEFGFPNDEAAQIAVQTIKNRKEQTKNKMKIIFNVFKEVDYDLYAKLLGANRKD